jgi:hypothetical protein
MALLDPLIPDSLKKRVRDTLGALNNGAMAPAFAARQAYADTPPTPPPAPNTAVRANVLTDVTPDQRDAGPPRPAPGVIDASSPVLRPPSPLDANQPLPAGVRRYQSDTYHGTPGSNDVIYEGRGAHGERSFSNNQFARTLTGRGADPTLDALAQRRSGEIQGSVDAATARANAAAGAAALAPKNATEYDAHLKTLADIAQLPDKATAQKLSNVKAAGENITNDPSTKTAEGVRLAAIASGATPEVALQRGHQAAAQEYLDQNNDPGAPNAPPVVRAGDTGVKKQLADLLEKSPRSIGSSVFGEGTVVDPGASDPGDYTVDNSNPLAQLFGRTKLTGPADKNGVRRTVYAPTSDVNQLAPYIQSRKRKLISDRK